MFSLIKTLFSSRWAVAIWSIFLACISGLWVLDPLPEVINTNWDLLPIQGQIKMLIAMTLLCVALVVSLYFANKENKELRENKLIPGYGILWDHKGNSFCPYCQSHTLQVVREASFDALKCDGCDKTIIPYDNEIDGYFGFKEARKRMSEAK